MHEEPGYLRSGTGYTVEREGHSLEQRPSTHRRVRPNPPIFSEEDLALISVRLITLPRTLGGKGNPTASLQSGSSS
jgi:hypothetical protein